MLDIDLLGEDGPTIQMELLTQTGQRTVPNVFIQGKHIGGDSDLTELYNSGEVYSMLDGLEEF